MKKVITINALLLTLGAIAFSGAANAASLLEVYQQALQSDPRIHEAEALRLAALEAKPQARGVLLPQIGFGGAYTKRTSSGTTVQPPLTTPFTNDSESEGTTWRFTLTQSLFRWDQIVNLKRADKTVAKAEALRESAQQDLIIRVALRYFNVLAAEDVLTSVHADRQAIARQLEQAKQRFDVGLIAITDVQESQAAYDQSTADEIGAKRSLATARNFLREITGEYVAELSAPDTDFPLLTPSPNNEADWVELSLSQNLALVASRLDEQLARDEISFRRNGYYPSIDLVASTSQQDTVDTNSINGVPGVASDIKFTGDSIGIQFNVPIFAGGTNTSRVREAVYLHRASREVLQRVTRETERQARDSYLGVLSEISRVKALEQAVASSRTALEQHRPVMRLVREPSWKFLIRSSPCMRRSPTTTAAVTITF